MKERNGKTLEKIIRLIQETLKDSENTKVFSNVRIENESGQKREIDILIDSSISDFKIKIAIECKDYSKKVPVKEIEAFQSKCDRIKEINKKVFVSTNGYQKDAIEAAKYYGIELHTASKIDEDVVRTWFPLKQMGLEILPEFIAPQMYLDANKEDLEIISKQYDQLIYREDSKNPIKVTEILVDAVSKNIKTVWNCALIEWLRLDDSKKEDSFPVGFRLRFNDSYIKTDRKGETKLLWLESSVMVRFIKRDPIILEGRKIKRGEDNIAKSITIDVGKNLKSDIIINNNNEFEFFVTDDKGETEKLETMFIYNSKTDTFSRE